MTETTRRPSGPVHLRRGDTYRTHCGRRLQRVYWTRTPGDATCSRCLALALIRQRPPPGPPAT